MDRNTWLFVATGLLLVSATGVAQFLRSDSTVSSVPPTASEFPSAGSGEIADADNPAPTADPGTTGSDSPAPLPAHPLPLTGDRVVTWDFQGAYVGNSDLESRAKAEITRLSGQFGKGEYSDVALYVGIANQYELLGDGKQAYEYLGRAVREDTNVTSGLPWHNLGTLMERLGAYKTARVAYEKSTLIQPGWESWHYAYLEFLTSRMKEDTATIEKAFAAAEKNIGQDTYLLQLRSDWEKP